MITTINEFRKHNENIVSSHTINIDSFDNEISHRQEWELDRRSGNKSFELDELKKLNLSFGTHKNIRNDYPFNLNFGGFGKERINFKGNIYKKAEYDKDGKKLLEDPYFLIDGTITVSLGNDKGNRIIIVKLENVQDVMNFFNKFEDNISFGYGDVQSGNKAKYDNIFTSSADWTEENLIKMEDKMFAYTGPYLHTGIDPEPEPTIKEREEMAIIAARQTDDILNIVATTSIHKVRAEAARNELIKRGKV